MSEWITDRLPTVEDSLNYRTVLVWDEKIGPMVWSYDLVNEGQPWQPIPTPEPYVKPKKWALEFGEITGHWTLVSIDGEVVSLYSLNRSQYEAAQRICDIYNEVLV